ncbi:unnamed protein product [Caenorhabditis brenneri]
MDIPPPHIYVNGRLRDSQLPTILATGMEMMENKFSTDWTRRENRLKINRVLDQYQEGVGLVHSDALFVGSLQISEYNAHTFKFGPKRERKSVFQYYENEKKITLKFPFLPLIYLKEDEGSMFPVELILLHSHRECLEAIEKRRLDQKQRDARKAAEEKKKASRT